MRKVYIVEDDQDLREMMQILLKKNGYSVLTCASAKQFQKSLKSDIPDLVILDINLSDESGVTLCKSIKSDRITQSLPVLLMSGDYIEPEVSKACMADEFVNKPFDIKDFLNKIKSLTSGAS